jgi:hypothetical protein
MARLNIAYAVAKRVRLEQVCRRGDGLVEGEKERDRREYCAGILTLLTLLGQRFKRSIEGMTRKL